MLGEEGLCGYLGSQLRPGRHLKELLLLHAIHQRKRVRITKLQVPACTSASVQLVMAQHFPCMSTKSSNRGFVKCIVRYRCMVCASLIILRFSCFPYNAFSPDMTHIPISDYFHEPLFCGREPGWENLALLSKWEGHTQSLLSIMVTIAIPKCLGDKI